MESSEYATSSNTKFLKKSKDRKQIYTCTLCNKELVGMAIYNYHLKKNHRDVLSRRRAPKRTFVCFECNKQLKGPSAYKNHLKLIHQVNISFEKLRRKATLIKCPVCRKTVHRYNLDPHLEKFHRSSLDKLSTFSCSYCERDFNIFANLLRHEKIMHRSSKNLNTNTRKQEQQTQLCCSKCNRTFSLHSWLIRHQKNCFAGENSISEQNLNQDPRMKQVDENSGQQIQKCSKCDRSFIFYAWLIKHERKCVGEFKCSYCPAKFLSKSNQTQHEKTIHPNGTVRIPHVTKNNRRKSRKMKNRVEKPLSALKSSEESKNLDHPAESYTPGGVKMVRANNLFCSYCPKSFANIYSKQLHEQLHTGDRPYQCTNCDASFRLQRTLSDHEEKCAGLIDVMWCDFCDFQNRSRFKLETHYQNSHGFSLDAYETSIRERSDSRSNNMDIPREENDVNEISEEKFSIKDEERRSATVKDEDDEHFSQSIIIDDDDSDEN